MLGREPASGLYVDRARYADAAAIPAALVVRNSGAWWYFNVDYISCRILELVDAAPSGLKAVVIDLSIVPAIDLTAATALRGLARALKARGITVVLAQMHDEVRENLQAVGAEEDLGSMPAHLTIADCIERTGAP